MSSYHTSFTYRGQNSYEHYKLQVVHFESGDTGEMDSYLSQEAIYQDSIRGTRRTMFGAKYDSVALLDITLMKPDGTEFGIEKTRKINKWLTGATQYSWIDLYIGDEVKYRMHGFVKDVRPYKLDSRIVGFIVTIESSSPWCYSTLQTITKTISGSATFDINNPSDDEYTYINLNAIFTSSVAGNLTIKNNTLNEETTVKKLASRETVTLSDNMLISSDKMSGNYARMFGSDFNYVWPRLKSGINNFTVTGSGNLTLEYIYPMKVADCVGDLNAASDPVCDEDGNIILDTLDWNRISNTPTTLQGYKITNAYTKTEVNNKITDAISNIKVDAYTKAEIDSKLENFTQADVYTKQEVDDKIANIDIPTIDAYTKGEVDKKLQDGYFTSTYIQESYYNKEEVDKKIAAITYDPETGTGGPVLWNQIIDKPTDLIGYGLKTEVQEMIDANIAASNIEINEEELNTMLAEVLGD